MMAGESADWDEFFAGRGVPAVLALVLDAWGSLAPPAEGEWEDATSVRLYAAMLKKRDRQAHPFLIRYQDVEIDSDLAKETGRKDIVFFPGHDGDIYFCLEAKRLNARVSGVMKSPADEYVEEGMQRFVDGKYSRHVHHGGMLGYVLDGDVPRAMQNVLYNIRARHVRLGDGCARRLGGITVSARRPPCPRIRPSSVSYGRSLPASTPVCFTRGDDGPRRASRQADPKATVR